MPPPTKWGILATGKICQDYATAIQNLSPEDHQIVAVGARTLKSAQEFAARFNIGKVYGSYEELAHDSDVDIIYIGTINPYHRECTQLMLNNNKAVICEKPMSMNQKEANEMIKLAKEKDLFLMEGMWSRFFPLYDKLREELSGNSFGKIHFININFGIDIWETPALVSQNIHGGGSLLALGVYPIQLVVLLFGEDPEKIVANSIIPKPNDVDIYTSINLYFSGGRVAQINLHLAAWMNNSALISAEHGNIEIPEFWAPQKLITPKKTYEFPLPGGEEKFNLPHSRGFIYQIKAIRESLLKGEKQNPICPLSESLRIVKIVDEIRRQIGLTFDADK